MILLFFVDFYRRPYTINNVLSTEEIQMILNKAKGKFKESKTVNASKPNYSIRKSKQTFLEEDNETLSLKNKVARLVGTEGRNCEKIQVVMYNPGDHYSIHQDTCCFESCRGSSDVDRRTKTVIVYLNDNFVGGETCFPNIDVCVKPEIGKALVFETYDAIGRCTRSAAHTGRPVKDGIKYICTFWFH